MDAKMDEQARESLLLKKYTDFQAEYCVLQSGSMLIVDCSRLKVPLILDPFKVSINPSFNHLINLCLEGDYKQLDRHVIRVWIIPLLFVLFRDYESFVHLGNALHCSFREREREITLSNFV